MSSNGIQGRDFNSLFRRFRLQRGLAFGIIIVAALLAFEIFNYSTTEYALSDLLGELSFLGIRWATILAIAFCGIDFAGIARLFTPEEGNGEQGEVWYLFGAWLLAATMNAMLTWWGVSLAVLNHNTLGNAVIERSMLLRIVPIFVAVLVWLIRVLIIGTFSVAGDRLFSQGEQHVASNTSAQRPVSPTANPSVAPAAPVRSLGGSTTRAPLPHAAASTSAFRPAPKAAPQPEPGANKPEPTYHDASFSDTPYASMSGPAPSDRGQSPNRSSATSYSAKPPSSRH